MNVHRINSIQLWDYKIILYVPQVFGIIQLWMVVMTDREGRIYADAGERSSTMHDGIDGSHSVQ